MTTNYSLGKGEVESSILSCSTIFQGEYNNIGNKTQDVFCADSSVNESGTVAKNWQGDLGDMERDDDALVASDDRYWERNYVYRYFSDDGRLLYVGITNSITRRHLQHAPKPWVAASRYIRVERVPFLAMAKVLEHIAYETEKPIYNHKVHYCTQAWRIGWEWYREKMNGAYAGDRVQWFRLDDWFTTASCEDPGFMA